MSERADSMGTLSPMTLRIEQIASAGNRLLRDFDPRRVMGLTPRGEWTENPDPPFGRVSNEILFRLERTNPEKRTAALKDLAALFPEKHAWSAAKKIFASVAASGKNLGPPQDEATVDRWISITLAAAGHPEPLHGFVVMHGALVWLVLHEALKTAAAAPVRSWDREGRARRSAVADDLRVLTAGRRTLSPPENTALDLALDMLRENPPDGLRGIPELIGEELDLDLTLADLLARARRPETRGEAYGLIIEKIRPAMGIVDNTSPAFLRPCLNLLSREALELDSGVPYNAAVILSILQDPRSAFGLLSALRQIPVSFSKIRENLIYTLGCLGEPSAVPLITPALEAPDETIAIMTDGARRAMLLREQKEEALRALGKIGAAALPALPALLPYADHEQPILRAYLAWTLGAIGLAQKKLYDGVSADIVITLLQLLKSKNRMVFEESVAALRRIHMPEFIHTLYLYSVGAVSILGLKPAQRGLYELSETLHHLIRTQGRAVIAVNGDSGTGKTYFCQAVQEGMGDISRHEILHLMRDRRRDQKIFNRLLGLDWLKKHIDPSYYENDPPPEDAADPESYFQSFLAGHADKKLILLDGCRDRLYFQRIIDLFHFHGLLDVEVNFRATLSTRRSNLEEREAALESVKTHLAFLEEPALEDTSFYTEGRVILYDMDNSTGSRLDRDEIRELFSKQKISNWGDLVRVGAFDLPADRIDLLSARLSVEEKRAGSRRERLPSIQKQPMEPRERKFRGLLNRDFAHSPHLLETIPMDDVQPFGLRPYAQDQIAGLGLEGEVFVLTFIDNRIFSFRLDSAADFALQGRVIYVISASGELHGLSFEREEKWNINVPGAPIRAIAGYGNRGIITGHADGALRIWCFDKDEITMLDGHRDAVTGLTSDYRGRVYSSGRDRMLRIWDPESERTWVQREAFADDARLEAYPPDRILAVTNPGNVGIVDLKSKTILSFDLPEGRKVSGTALHPDGRILLGTADGHPPTRKGAGEVAILTPEKHSATMRRLSSHSRRTHGLLVQGPRIITCGSDVDDTHSLRILGNEYFVRTEAARRDLQPD